MANNFRRYSPRRSAGSSPWARLLVIGVIIVILVLIGRAVFSRGGRGADSNTNEPVITLVNDAAKANINAVGPTNANATTNVSVVPPTTAIPEGVCETPLSKYGTEKNVVLTFEMSAANDNAKKLLEQMKKDKTAASFFSTGVFAEKNPDFLRSFTDAGYGVYNRGYDSTNLTTLEAPVMTAQLAKAATAIEAATEVPATPFLRPAFSATNETVLSAATAAGYCIILGTVDATDWQDGVTVQAAVDRVMAKLQPGAIVQLHAGYDITATVVTALTKELKAKGYNLVTLATLISS